MKKLIVISGPTASGKTSLSVQLAEHFNTCILSADSRQFYREITIGTAKPTEEEQKGIKHYFIDSHNLEDQVTASQYEKEALEVLENEFKTNEVIVLVGGSGMFIDALCDGLDDIPSSTELKKEIQLEFDKTGLEPLLNELEQKDPEYFQQVDRSNPMRIMRAIEAIRLTGKTFSEQRIRKTKKRPFEVIRFVIDHDREKLYDRINLRVDLMLKEGLLEEVKAVHKLKHLTSLNTVGYKEVFEFLEGNCSLDESIEKIKQNSRRYAKRQLTWFRRNQKAHWIKFDNNAIMMAEIIEKIAD